jgi:hypothetical protein
MGRLSRGYLIDNPLYHFQPQFLTRESTDCNEYNKIMNIKDPQEKARMLEEWKDYMRNKTGQFSVDNICSQQGGINGSQSKTPRQSFLEKISPKSTLKRIGGMSGTSDTSGTSGTSDQGGIADRRLIRSSMPIGYTLGGCECYGGSSHYGVPDLYDPPYDSTDKKCEIKSRIRAHRNTFEHRKADVLNQECLHCLYLEKLLEKINIY